MGLARLRARHLGAGALQLALWDGQPGSGPAGTASDVARWRALGGAVELVDPGPVDRQFERAPVPEPGRWPREMRAILFGDFAGFSRLGELELPQFWELVMERAGAVLDRHRPVILGANTWGDALFAYTAGIADAAGIALELQAALAEAPLVGLGLDQAGGMRLGVHFGPVYTARDPVTGRDNIFGTEVIRTARVEPGHPDRRRLRHAPVSPRCSRSRRRGALRARLCRHRAAGQGLRRAQDVPPEPAAMTGATAAGLRPCGRQLCRLRIFEDHSD